MSTGGEEGKYRKKRLPIEEGIFTMPSSPEEKPRLIGAMCNNCGTVIFPRQDICINCCKQDTETICLSTKGTIWSSSITRRKQPLYEGQVPYANGLVELPEGVLVPGIFSGCGTDEPAKIGTTVEMELVKWGEDSEANDIVAYVFRITEPS